MSNLHRHIIKLVPVIMLLLASHLHAVTLTEADNSEQMLHLAKIKSVSREDKYYRFSVYDYLNGVFKITFDTLKSDGPEPYDSILKISDTDGNEYSGEKKLAPSCTGSGQSDYYSCSLGRSFPIQRDSKSAQYEEFSIVTLDENGKELEKIEGDMPELRFKLSDSGSDGILDTLVIDKKLLDSAGATIVSIGDGKNGYFTVADKEQLLNQKILDDEIYKLKLLPSTCSEESDLLTFLDSIVIECELDDEDSHKVIYTINLESVCDKGTEAELGKCQVNNDDMASEIQNLKQGLDKAVELYYEKSGSDLMQDIGFEQSLKVTKVHDYVSKMRSFSQQNVAYEITNDSSLPVNYQIDDIAAGHGVYREHFISNNDVQDCVGNFLPAHSSCRAKFLIYPGENTKEIDQKIEISSELLPDKKFHDKINISVLPPLVSHKGLKITPASMGKNNRVSGNDTATISNVRCPDGSTRNYPVGYKVADWMVCLSVSGVQEHLKVSQDSEHPRRIYFKLKNYSDEIIKIKSVEHGQVFYDHSDSPFNIGKLPKNKLAPGEEIIMFIDVSESYDLGNIREELTVKYQACPGRFLCGGKEEKATMPFLIYDSSIYINEDVMGDISKCYLEWWTDVFAGKDPSDSFQKCFQEASRNNDYMRADDERLLLTS